MKDMHKLKDLLRKELEEYYNRDKLTMSDLEILNKLTDTIKNIDKIEMLEDGGEYSQYDGMNQDGGYSYRRQRRDSRGRYSRDAGMNRGGSSYDNGMNHNGGANRRGGYSYGGDKEELFEMLDEMMEDAPEKERRAIMEFRDAMHRN